MHDSPTILIIEDDPVFRRVIGFTLEKNGMRVETADDGQSGYDRLMRGDFDLIVTDYQMPVCGALELLQRLDRLPDYQRPPTILCTAKGLELDSDMLQRTFDLTAILHKPFSPRHLVDVIRNNLDPQEV
ncbi:response regulator [Roseiconus nitratireducens]|uniref:Response regulator n=1 Tax=Roseiconus nitratireducens TaxID=2605748 RepID=A0A5M6D4K1_9BACT|nr:response regulator [Roseiconus nitratireducens]KAA5540679.1 response regulator [Roseiconus nitratireducens]